MVRRFDGSTVRRFDGSTVRSGRWDGRAVPPWTSITDAASRCRTDDGESAADMHVLYVQYEDGCNSACPENGVESESRTEY